MSGGRLGKIVLPLAPSSCCHPIPATLPEHFDSFVRQSGTSDCQSSMHCQVRMISRKCILYTLGVRVALPGPVEQNVPNQRLQPQGATDSAIIHAQKSKTIALNVVDVLGFGKQ
jgi:hypothetical protein